MWGVVLHDDRGAVEATHIIDHGLQLADCLIVFHVLRGDVVDRTNAQEVWLVGVNPLDQPRGAGLRGEVRWGVPLLHDVQLVRLQRCVVPCAESHQLLPGFEHLVGVVLSVEVQDPLGWNLAEGEGVQASCDLHCDLSHERGLAVPFEAGDHPPVTLGQCAGDDELLLIECPLDGVEDIDRVFFLAAGVVRAGLQQLVQGETSAKVVGHILVLASGFLDANGASQ